MRAVIQRVSRARVTVADQVVGQIGIGLLVLLGVSRKDTVADAEYLATRVIHLRIFDDDTGRMNRSVVDIGGEVLVVSQFTLYGDTRKGRRPAYDEAAVSAAMKRPEISLKVALGLGKGRDRVLTCDLTKEYVAINGDYRS